MNKSKQLRADNRRQLKEWRKYVLERAHYKCEWCGATRYIQCHHIINRKLLELRYDTDNGIVLCSRCHTFGTGTSAHHNPFRIVIWLFKNRPDSLDKLMEWTLKHDENIR